MITGNKNFINWSWGNISNFVNRSCEKNHEIYQLVMEKNSVLHFSRLQEKNKVSPVSCGGESGNSLTLHGKNHEIHRLCVGKITKFVHQLYENISEFRQSLEVKYRKIHQLVMRKKLQKLSFSCPKKKKR